MLKCFKELDLNGDGVLSREELAIGLSKYLDLSIKEATTIAKGIFRKVDTNNSGFIDYSEFVVSAGKMELIVTEENLELAFDCLDENKNGSLSAKELRDKLGVNISEESYEELLKEFKLTHNGEVTHVLF